MTVKLKLPPAAGVVLAAAFSSFTLRAALPPEEIYQTVSPSTVTLDVENASGRHFVGTAFLAVGDGLAVTAWHVVRGAQRVEARFSDGRQVPVAGLVDRNDNLDLALIRIECAGRPGLQLCPTTPRVGSRVYLMGAPRGFGFSISDGLLSQIRTLDRVRYYQVSCPISAGDSGGPVLNDRAEVVGIMSWRKTDAENVSFAIPAGEVARLNAAARPTPWTAEAAPSLAPGGPIGPDAARHGAMPVTAPSVEGGFNDLQRWLSQHVGRRVTVTVEEDRSRQSRFSFEVPGTGLR
jgi:S1-C subfamily serine protease